MQGDSSVPHELGGGRYKVAGLLGAGGMALVFRATDTTTGQECAVKVLRPERRNDANTVARFRREARSMLRVRHDNVVTVHAVSEGDEQPYIVMELVRGRTLAEEVRKAGPMVPLEAVKVTCAVLGALEAAHTAGVVHRDIKPENVLVGPAGPKVTDFGIARMAGGSGDEQLTHTGAVLGTEAYRAPEQVMDARTVDARADIYATGAMMYRLLTGKRPYSLFQEEADSERLARIPRTLRAIVIKATRYEPSERFATAREMRQALEDLPTSALASTPRPPLPDDESTEQTIPPELKSPLRRPPGRAEPATPAPIQRRAAEASWRAFVVGGIVVACLLLAGAVGAVLATQTWGDPVKGGGEAPSLDDRPR